MPRLIPFSNSFSTTSGSQGTVTYNITGSMLKSFSAYVETDNVGVIFIDVHLLVEDKKHQLGQDAIYDADGYNARKLTWTGELPLSRYLVNKIVVNYSNYCGSDAVIRFTGVKKA